MATIETYDDWAKERLAKLEGISEQLDKRIEASNTERLEMSRQFMSLYQSTQRALWILIAIAFGGLVSAIASFVTLLLRPGSPIGN